MLESLFVIPKEPFFRRKGGNWHEVLVDVVVQLDHLRIPFADHPSLVALSHLNVVESDLLGLNNPFLEVGNGHLQIVNHRPILLNTFIGNTHSSSFKRKFKFNLAN